MSSSQRNRRRIFSVLAKSVVGLVAFGIIILLASYLFLLTGVGHEFLRRRVLSALKDTVPGLEIGQIEGNYLSHLALDRVIIRDADGHAAIAAKRIDAHYSLAGLLQRRVSVRSVTVVAPELRLRQLPGGELNITQLVKTKPVTKADRGPSAWTIDVERAELMDGALSGTRETPLQGGWVRDIHIAATLTHGPKETKVHLDTFAVRARLPVLQEQRPFELRARAHFLAGLDHVQATATIESPDFTPAGPIAFASTAEGPLNAVLVSGEMNTPRHGRLHWKGTFDLNSGLGDYGLSLSALHLNPSTLRADLPAADAGFALSAQGHGIPFAEGNHSRVHFRLSPSMLLGKRVKSLSLDAHAKGDHWVVMGLNAESMGTVLHLRGAGHGRTAEAHAVLSSEDLAELPLPPGLGLAGILRVEAKASGSLGRGFHAQVQLSGRNLAAQGVSIRQLGIAGNVTSRQRSFSGVMGASADGVRMRGPDGKPVDLDKVSATVTGSHNRFHFDVSGKGRDLAAWLVGQAELDEDTAAAQFERLSVRYRDRHLELGAPADVRYWFSKRASIHAPKVMALGGNVQLAAEASFGRVLRYQVDTAVDKIQLMRGKRFSAKLSARSEAREVNAGGTLTLDTDQPPITFALRVPLHPASPNKYPRLVTNHAADLQLDAPPVSLKVIGEYLALFMKEPPQMAGAVAAHVRVHGSLRAPSGELSAETRGLSWGELTHLDSAVRLNAGTSGIIADVWAAQRKQRLLSLHFQTPCEPWKLRDILASPRRGERLEFVPAVLRLDVPERAIESLPYLPSVFDSVHGHYGLSLTASGSMAKPDIRLRLKADRAQISEYALGRLFLNADVIGSGARTRLVLVLARDHVPLVKVTGDTEATGVTLFGKRGWQKEDFALSLFVPSVPLTQFDFLSPVLKASKGVLSATVKAGGQLDTPQGRAQLSVKDVEIQQVPVGSLAAEGNFGDKQLQARLTVHQLGGGWLQAQMGTDLGRKPAPVQGKLEVKELSLEPLKYFFDVVRESGGHVDGAVALSGTLAQPQLNGRIRLADGLLRLRGSSRLSDIQVAVSLAPRRISLDQLSVHSGGGSLQANAHLNLDKQLPTDFALEGNAHKFQIGWGPVRQMTFSGPIHLSGALSRGELLVSAKTNESVATVPEKLPATDDLYPTDMPADLVLVGKKSQAQDHKANSAKRVKEIKLRFATSPLFVRGKEIDVAIMSDVMVELDQAGQSHLYGQVEVTNGWVRILNNRYEVRRAVVQFTGEKDPNPGINVEIWRQFVDSDATVTITVTGSAKDPHVDFTSDPPIYDQSQIISLIVTGHTQAVGQNAGVQTDYTAMATAAISEVLLGGILSKVAGQVGLDVARVSVQQPTQGSQPGEISGYRAQTELGKYLTDRLYVGYRRTFGASQWENANEGHLEYRISPRWVLNALFGDADVGGVDLFWDRLY